jgi:outer membrane autotransporter protein
MTTATGINNSDEIFLSAGVDYEFDLSGFAVKPGVRLDLVKVWMDAYTETGAGMDNVSYGAFDITSFTSDIGGEVSYACKIGAGMLTPRVYGYWVHEYQDDVQALTYSIGGGPLLTVLTDSSDRNYGRVGAGASLDLQRGLEIYVDYQALVGLDRINSHQFAAGGRFEF